MKKNLVLQLVLAGLISFLWIFYSCNKDEDIIQEPIIDQEVTFRSGGALIFYQTSLTMDNRLIVPSQDSIRRHTIFNKNKIENVIYEDSGEGIANVFGTDCRHYNIIINFKDSSELSLNAFALDVGDYFVQDVSNCIQVLKPSHNASILEIERLSTKEKKYNLWSDEIKMLNYVLIKKDGVFVGKYLLDPLEYPQTQFSPKHVH